LRLLRLLRGHRRHAALLHVSQRLRLALLRCDDARHRLAALRELIVACLHLLLVLNGALIRVSQRLNGDLRLSLS